jgi:hypothetical protein
MLDEDWATRHGGAVLYEETREAMRARRAIDICMVVLIISLAIIVILVMVLFVHPDDSSDYLVVALGLGFAVFVLFLATLGIREVKDTVPFRIHDRGVLLGSRKKFLRFEEVFRVEKATTPEGKKVTVITPVDATPVWIIAGEGPVKGVSAVVHSKDYEIIGDILRRKAFEEGADILDWTDSAMAFMESVQFAKGPVMASAEKVAKDKGIERIGARFLVENRSEIADGLMIWGQHFAEFAKKTEKRWRESGLGGRGS